MPTWGSKNPDAALFLLQKQTIKMRAIYEHILGDELLSWGEVSSETIGELQALCRICTLLRTMGGPQRKPESPNCPIEAIDCVRSIICCLLTPLPFLLAVHFEPPLEGSMQFCN